MVGLVADAALMGQKRARGGESWKNCVAVVAYGVSVQPAVGRTVGGVEIGQHLAAHWSPRKWMNCLLKCRSGAPVEGETELW